MNVLATDRHLVCLLSILQEEGYDLLGDIPQTIQVHPLSEYVSGFQLTT